MWEGIQKPVGKLPILKEKLRFMSILSAATLIICSNLVLGNILKEIC